jgi:hypothetical protein
MRYLILAIGVLCLLAAFSVKAGPYVEIKSEVTYKDFSIKDKTNHARFGYQKKNVLGNVYFEAGHMTGGSSWEAGYKTRLSDTLVIKGKLEGKHERGLQSKTKLETEIRYTW